MTTFKHLLIIRDGETSENSLHVSERTRAERLIALLKGNELRDDELTPDDVEDALEEAETDASQAEYPPGESFIGMDPEDYMDTLGDLLSSADYDLYLADLDTPTSPLEVTTA